jgi:antitoxin component HigA of HigAB toxin-antitoxin module
MRARVTIKPARTRADHDRILKLIELLMDAAEKGTLSDAARDLLLALIAMHEAERWSLDLPDPIEAIEVVMDPRDMRPRM